MEYLRVREQVQARLALSVVECAKTAMLNAIQGSNTFKSAPLLDPPIPTGMTDTMAQLKRILVRPQPVSRTEYLQIPTLLRRIIYLLRVYYDAKTNVRRSPDFKYCDYEDVTEFGPDLHRIGLTLHLMPSRLRLLFKSAPDMEKLMFEDTIDVGSARIKADQEYNRVYSDPFSEDDDIERAIQAEDEAQEDMAAYYLAFIYGDILSAWLIIKPLDDEEKEWVNRAARRLVEFSTKRLYRRALGDNLTDPMLAIYRDQKATQRFARRGGLTTLFGDWVDSIAKDGACRSAIENLPSETWGGQMEETVSGVLNALRSKIFQEGDVIVVTPIFVTALYEIFSRYGKRPFEKASQVHDEYDTIFFLFVYKRLARKGSAYRSLEGMHGLLQKYTCIPEIVRRRYLWASFPLPTKWRLLKKSSVRYGCANIECPEEAELKELGELSRRDVRDLEVEERLEKWGSASKLCKRCWTVVYCSTECQRGCWESHKPNCKEKDSKEKSEMIVEI